MKGIILAGGLGTRLQPLTKVTNKHLLPVYDKPMVYYPLETLVRAGIQDIMVVTGGNNAGDFLRLLGDGKEFGLRHLHFAYQDGEGGIAGALSLAEYFAAADLLCVILGDNILEKSIRPYVEKFRDQGQGAKILLKEVPNPQRFGVPELQEIRSSRSRKNLVYVPPSLLLRECICTIERFSISFGPCNLQSEGNWKSPT